MIWPPVKAWTSQIPIEGQKHFVAINYGGKPLKRWVILMSVIYSNVVIKVLWSQLLNISNWECGWSEKNRLNSSININKKYKITTCQCIFPSNDSGLTVPMTGDIIRPWFGYD